MLAPGWPAIGTPATRAAGNQYGQVMVSDGQGGAFVAWEDHRSVFATGVDLYAQHVLGNGQIAPGWPADGLPVCVANGDQGYSQLLFDGAGGLVLVWEDGRGGPGIYAQHLRGDGVRVLGWPENGLAVSGGAAGGEGSSWLVNDGEGGIIVAWGRVPSGNGVEIYAQRINWWGEVAPGWPVGGRRVAPAAGVWGPWPAGMAPDGAGGAYIGWMHGYDFNFSDADIYAVRILPDGSVAPGWAAGGNPVAVATNAQIITSVVADSAGGVMLAWYDTRSYPVVRAMVARLQRNGTVAPGWQPNGNVASDIPGYQYSPYLAPDGQGGAYVAFSDAGAEKGYVQHLSAGGSLAPGWPSAGIPLVNLDASQRYLAITPDGLGGAIVAWEDFRSGIQDQIYAQRFFLATDRRRCWSH
jgi:hypothetical protein